MPEQLMRYWSTGAGAAKINWGTKDDFYRCKTALAQYVDEGMLDGLCNNLHRRATGYPPGQAPSEGGKGH